MTIRRVSYGRGHGYVDVRDNGDSVKIPGVTAILGDGLAKPALVAWAANQTAAYAVDHWDELAELPLSQRMTRLQKARFEDLDAASGRGTAVHKLAQRLVAGDRVDVPDPLAGHVESYVKFLDQWDVQPLLVEATIVNRRHGYAGTLDLVSDFPTLDQRLLCDVKTARSGVFPDNALQLAGYRYADAYLHGATEKPMIPVDGCAVIHVRADGYDLVPVEAGPVEHRFFLYAQQMWRWANEHSRTVRGDALTPPIQEEANTGGH